MFGRKTSHNSKDDGGWQDRSLTRKKMTIAENMVYL